MQQNLNKLSIDQLEKALSTAKDIKSKIANKGKTHCIIRTYSAGVFAGLYDRATKGKEATIYNARRIFYWDGAASLSQLANEGVKKPENCKFAQEVAEVDLKEIIEVIPTTEEARKNIEAVEIWKK